MGSTTHREHQMIKVAAATLVAAASIATAAPASATTTPDSAFIHALKEFGITVEGSLDSAIAIGRAVCDDLNIGMTIAETAVDVFRNTTLTPSGAERFTAAAVATFCGWRIPAENRGVIA